MYKCCIFDLDGTLVNTIDSLSRSVSLTMNHFGYGDVDVAHTKVFVGDGYKKLVERALIYSGDEALTHYEEALGVYREIFKENSLYRAEAYDGIPELLEFLKGRGIKIGILTNKPHDRAVECAEAVFEKGYFDLIIGEGKGVVCKPDPSGAWMAAKHFQAKPEECLYFGDTDTDMKTGLNAGMDAVAVTWGFRGREELEAFQPKYVIDHPNEIKPVFE